MEKKYFKFGEVASFKYGKMPDKKKMVDKETFPVYSGYRIVGYYPEYNVEKNQLIIVARGVGGAGDVKLSPEKCWLTNLSIVADVDDSVVREKYLYYLFQIQNLRYLDSGSAQSQITIADLEKVSLELPKIDVQDRIINILEILDAKIIENERINNNLAA